MDQNIPSHPSKPFRTWRKILLGDTGLLFLLALGWLILLTLVSLYSSRQYGFHRDELAFLDNARHLDWGYVEYPPLTPFIGRVGLELFGPSHVGIHFLSSLAMSAILLLGGLMARELGGSRRAQIVAALAAATAPVALFYSQFFSYETFDYLWWVLASYLVIRLIKSDNPRFWLGIGAVIGLGMMTKYTMIFWVISLVVGVLLTPLRKYLKSRWLWAGVALALLIFLPNLVWQVQHHFISIDFTQAIHSRDIRIGRAENFLISQLYACTNPAALPLWLAGLYSVFFTPGLLYRHPGGASLRALGWMFLVPLLMFAALRGRFYYIAPAYPMLIAAGSVWMFGQPQSSSSRWSLFGQRLQTGALVITGLVMMALMLPLAPVNSSWWKVSLSLNYEPREMIGWRELVKTVADIYAKLPASDRTQTGILAGNFGEAGAIDLYGPAYGLPTVISGTDTYWLRGYSDPPPQVLIVVGMDSNFTGYYFESCTLSGTTSNRFGILNEETRYHPIIFVCRNLRTTWPEFWKQIKSFG